VRSDIRNKEAVFHLDEAVRIAQMLRAQAPSLVSSPSLSRGGQTNPSPESPLNAGSACDRIREKQRRTLENAHSRKG
jgi:hypothetical protein